MIADPELAPYFAGQGVDRHARHVRPLIAGALGGPELYRGRDMAAAHAELGITGAHFERAVRHIGAVLAGLGVDDGLSQRRTYSRSVSPTWSGDMGLAKR